MAEMRRRGPHKRSARWLVRLIDFSAGDSTRSDGAIASSGNLDTQCGPRVA